MNKIIIFTESNVPVKHLASFEKSDKWEITALSHTELRKKLKKSDGDTVYITDYASIPETDKAKDLNYLLKKQDAARAVIDRKNEIEDPAEIVIKGCDYISSKLLKDGLKPVRLNKYKDFFQILTGNDPASQTAAISVPQTSSGDSDSTFIIAENGWNEIKSGREYSFFMLFAEISIPSAWKKKSGSVHLNNLKKTFQQVVEKTVTPFDGKIWIWNEYGGLVLFPYNGSSCSPVIPAVKLLLNRVLISIEEFKLHTPIKLRASMHLGNTTWKARGKTGTIISDSLNSIFHLGTKYTPIDDLDITEDVYNTLISGLKKLFVEAGTFEGRKIYRFCHLKVVS